MKRSGTLRGKHIRIRWFELAEQELNRRFGITSKHADPKPYYENGDTVQEAMNKIKDEHCLLEIGEFQFTDDLPPPPNDKEVTTLRKPPKTGQ